MKYLKNLFLLLKIDRLSKKELILIPLLILSLILHFSHYIFAEEQVKGPTGIPMEKALEISKKIENLHSSHKCEQEAQICNL